MKAIVVEKSGGVQNLLIRNIEKPVLKENEVLLEIKALSINPVDYKVRAVEEILSAIYGEERPAIIGWDIAGVVVEKGIKVSSFEVGDKVFGMVNFPGAGKAYAEYVATPEDQLALIPENISIEEAAASTLAALTALQAMESRVKKGNRVLIHAGSGGVGHFAIQIAKNMGAYVIATSSAKNRDFIMSLGADEHIDYRTKKFEEELNNIDFVLDPLAGEVLLKSTKIMSDGGNIVSIATFEVPADVQAEAEKREVTVTPMLVKSSGNDMNTLAGLLENGALKAHVSKTFSFDEMAAAHLEMESGRTVGKIVVTM